MKRLLLLAVLTLLLVAPAARAADSDPVAQATAAAKAWLALVDAGKYGESWDQAAALFKLSVARPGWEGMVKSVRAPLGAVKSRQVKAATFTRSLPGVPPGDYVVIQYETQFQNKPAAVETVTPMRDQDGVFRVSGYFIR